MGRPSAHASQRSRAQNRQKPPDFVNYGTAMSLLRAQAPESPHPLAQTYTPPVLDEPHQVPVDAPTPIWGVVAQEIAAMYPGPDMGGPWDTTYAPQSVDDWPIDPALTLGMDMEWTGTGATLDASFGIPALKATCFDISAIPSPPPGWPDADKLHDDPSTSSFNRDPDAADSITVATPSQRASPASSSQSVNKSSSRAGQSTGSRISKSSSRKCSKKAAPSKNKQARGPSRQMDEVNATKLPQLPQPKRTIDPLATPEPDEPPAPSGPDVSPGSCPPGVLPTAHLPRSQFPYPHPLLPTEDATLMTLRQAGWRYVDIIDHFKGHFGPRITRNALVKRSQKLHSLYGAVSLHFRCYVP